MREVATIAWEDDGAQVRIKAVRAIGTGVTEDASQAKGAPGGGIEQRTAGLGARNAAFAASLHSEDFVRARWSGACWNSASLFGGVCIVPGPRPRSAST